MITLATPSDSLGRAFGVHRAMDTTGALLGPLLAAALIGLAAGYDTVFGVSFCLAVVGVLILIFFVPAPVRRTPAPGGVSPRRALAVLARPGPRRACVAAGLLGLVTVGDMVLYVAVQQRAGLPTAVLPLLPLGTAVTFLAAAAALGRVADRVGRWRVFLAGHGLLLAAYLLVGLAGGWPMAVLALGLHGLFYAATDGVLMAYAGPLIPSELRATGLAAVQTVQALARAGGAIVVGAALQFGSAGGLRGAGGAARRRHPGRGPIGEAVMTVRLGAAAMRARPRVIGAVLIAVTLLAGAGYTGWRLTATRSAGGGQLDLARAGTVLYVDHADGRVRQMLADAPDAVVGTGPVCHRAYAAGGTLACLRPAAIPGGFEVAMFDAALREQTVVPVWGTPSRARVSASGRLVAWTVFRSGDSYLAAGGFSTTAGAYDLATGAHYGSLEDFASIVDGREHVAADRNFWGITFASDDRTFYATMSSGGKIWLMRGDLPTRRMEAIRENVECPSLSPDGNRIAYKKRTGQQWRVHVLDLATGTDVALAETGNVDDQPAWLDGGTIGYARPMGDRPALFAVPADGTGAPRPLRSGSSPTALR